MFKKTLLWVLIVSFSFGQVTAYGQSLGGLQSSSNLAGVFNPPSIAPFDQSQKELVEFADLIENGGLSKRSVKEFDLFHLSGQRVEVYADGNESRLLRSIQLDDIRVQAPSLAYTRVKAYFKKDTKELVFEATRGENNQGELGTVVARQFIPNMDIVALAQDQEIVSVIDRQGRLHVVDMGFVSEQIFQSAIPVFQNLWEPSASVNLSNVKVEAGYMTRGMRPFSQNQLRDSALFPRNSEGQPIYTAGDLAVTVTGQDGVERVYGVFSREVTHERLARGSIILQYLATLVSPDPNDVLKIKDAVAQIEKYELQTNAQLAQENMPVAVRETLISMGSPQIASLQNRQAENEKAATRRYDKFSAPEWETSYKDYVVKFEAAHAKAVAEKERLPVLSEDWQSFVTPHKTVEVKRSILARSMDRFKGKMNLRILTSVFGGALMPTMFGSIAVMGAIPYAMDAGVFDQIKSITWLYHNYYPPVLKDAEYRVPLLLSMTSLMALWPLAQIMSSLSGKALTVMSKSVQNSNSATAGYIRDLQRHWSPLETWQRIVTFGMRIYSYTIYPYLKVLVKTAFNQKSFMAALENGQNPFQTVSPESELGKYLGLEKSQTVGLNNPFLKGEELQKNIHEKNRIQSAQVEIGKRRQTLAWMLAAVAVSENTKIDLATLLFMGPTGISSQELDAILSDGQKKRDWYLLAKMADKDLQLLSDKNFLVEMDQIPKEEIAKAYVSIQASAKAIQALPEWKKKTQILYDRFKRASLGFKTWAIQFGEKEAAFLRSVYTNSFVSGQVKQEFQTDHSMVVLAYGLVGERANLAKPELLSATPNGILWTSGPHLYDVALNTYVHYFVAGSRMALVFQGVKAKEELRYFPLEDFSYVPNERTEPFWKTGVRWSMDVASPWKTDVGGIAVKRLKVQLRTIQASITQAVVLRIILAKQTVVEAFSGWYLMFAAQQIFFGWLWDITQAGNQGMGERFAGLEQQMKSIRSRIAHGERVGGKDGEAIKAIAMAEMRELYEKHNPEALKAAETAKGSRLSAQEILQLSIDSSPVYTRPHPFMSWSAVWTAALGSTLLSIPLAVMTFDKGALEPMSLLKWTGYAVAFYSASYFTLGQRPWLYYRAKIDQFKNSNTGIKIIKGCRSVINTLTGK